MTSEKAGEDLKAFERRLQEIVGSMVSDTQKYRLALAIITACTAYGAFQWLTDPFTPRISLFRSLFNHPFFTLNAIILILLFALTSIHKKVISPQIILSRTRQVLPDFCMTCDDNGRLILLRSDQRVNRKSMHQMAQERVEKLYNDLPKGLQSWYQ